MYLTVEHSTGQKKLHFSFHVICSAVRRLLELGEFADTRKGFAPAASSDTCCWSRHGNTRQPQRRPGTVMSRIIELRCIE